jgi:hypothetical protein
MQAKAPEAIACSNHVAPGQAHYDKLPRRFSTRNDMIATWYYLSWLEFDSS